MKVPRNLSFAVLAFVAAGMVVSTPATAQKKPNVVMLMTDDTGWKNLGAIGAVYNLTMDPFEKYDMTFNGAVDARLAQPSPGKYAGQDNGWVLALIFPVVMEFNKSIVDYPSIKRSPGGSLERLEAQSSEPGQPRSIDRCEEAATNQGSRRLVRCEQQKKRGMRNRVPRYLIVGQ